MKVRSNAAGNFLDRARSSFSFLARFGGEKSYLSLDIGSSSIKMLETAGSENAPRILSAGIVPLPPNAVQNNLVQDVETVTRAIRTLIEQYRPKASEAITAVPGPAVIIKRVSFPAQEPTELDETIFFEAGNFIPESLDNVNLDYQVLDHDPETDHVDVLLVAVRRDVINSYTEAISEAGLKPIVVDVDYFALENMFENNYTPAPDEVIALVNIGARYSSINIMKDGRSVFTGDVPIGGKQYTDLLEQELGLTPDQAEEVKVQGPVENDKKETVEQIVAATSEQLLDEVQRALGFFWAGSTEEQINSIYLSGGTCQLPGLAAAMNDRLQIPVEISNPFRLLNLSRQVDDLLIRQNAPAFAVSVGLAVRRPGDK